MSQWNRPESIEQRALVKRLFLDPRLQDVPWFAVPNGANKSINQAKLFKAEGLRAGVPDLIFPVRSVEDFYIGLAIEMKRPDLPGKRKAVVSVEQLQFMAMLETQGWRVEVCKSAEEAWWHIAKHLDLRDNHGMPEAK